MKQPLAVGVAAWAGLALVLAAPRAGGQADTPPPVPDTKQDRPPPPPPAPETSPQEPRPYVPPVESGEPQRKVVVAPHFVVWNRTSERAGVTYTTGVAYGASARIEILEWLGVRAMFNRGTQGVEIDNAALGLPASNLTQPPLSIDHLALRVELTWVPKERLRLWGGPSAAWAHASAPAPETSGPDAVKTDQRAGVFTELGAAFGATFDLIPYWLALTAAVSGGVVTGENGDLFRPLQAVSDNGSIIEIRPLPGFGAVFAAELGAGIIL